MLKHTSDIDAEIFYDVCSGEGATIKKDLTGGIKPINVRTCAEMQLVGGSSIGYHVHKNETEIYYIISGEGEYSDNGEIKCVKGGDACLCLGGQGHSLKNTGVEPLKFIAVIVLE